MPDLPSRGRCHAIFLLAYSARVRRCDDIDAWLRAAIDKPTHMAASLDLGSAARLLMDVGLARPEDQIVISCDLAKLDRVADLTTLKGIARLLLARRPPDWLRSVVVDGKLAPEFIPKRDLEAISWLGSDLEAIVVAVHAQLYGAVDNALLKRLGDAGELAVMSAFRLQNREPRHVALVSDRFGYDIELSDRSYLQGIEVKTAITSTASRILVTRNEFEVARRMGDRWRAVQVTFSSRVIAHGRAAAADILAIRELSSASLIGMAPAEKDVFRWVDSAEFRPNAETWTESDLVVGQDFAAHLADT